MPSTRTVGSTRRPGWNTAERCCGGSSRRVGATHDRVVPLGQEPHRRRFVGSRPRRIRQIEQLAAALPAKRHEPRPQRFEHRPQRRNARPRLRIGGGRRPVCGEVSQHEILGRGGRRLVFGFPSQASAVMKSAWRESPRRLGRAPAAAAAACGWCTPSRGCRRPDARPRGDHETRRRYAARGSTFAPAPAAAPSRCRRCGRAGSSRGRDRAPPAGPRGNARNRPAVIMCSVPRSDVPRTSRLSSNACTTSSRRSPSTRDHSPITAGAGVCACRPTRCSVTDRAMRHCASAASDAPAWRDSAGAV